MTTIPEWALLEAVGLKVEQKYQTSGGLSAQSGAPWDGTNGEFEIITRSLAVRTKAKEIATRGRNDRTLYYNLLAARNYPNIWARLLAEGSSPTGSDYNRAIADAVDAVERLRK